MSNSPRTNRPKTLLFGMPGALFTPVLMMLEYLGIPVCGIVTLAAPGATVDISTHRWLPRGSVMHLGTGGDSAVPHFQVRNLRSPAVTGPLIALAPDLIIVSCFPWLLPSELHSAATWLALNVHPSLLPAHRGPDPIFWTFHSGARSTGVSIHVLDDRFDTGPVLVQTEVAIGPASHYTELEQQLGRIGAELLAGILEHYPDRPAPLLPTASLPSYEGHATVEDLLIDPAWSVDRARRFVGGVAATHGPLRYQVRDGRSLRVTGLGTAAEGTEIVLRNGTLRVRIASPLR